MAAAQKTLRYGSKRQEVRLETKIDRSGSPIGDISREFGDSAVCETVEDMSGRRQRVEALRAPAVARRVTRRGGYLAEVCPPHGKRPVNRATFREHLRMTGEQLSEQALQVSKGASSAALTRLHSHPLQAKQNVST